MMLFSIAARSLEPGALERHSRNSICSICATSAIRHGRNPGVSTLMP
jgi:hypothetical protein